MIERILIVGLGSIGRRHLNILRIMFPHSDIRILRRTYSDVIPELANGVFSDINHAISFAPNFAIICNASSYHIPCAQILSEAGIHLFVEKPISDSLNGIQKLIDTCSKNQLTLQVGYNMRFLPSLQFFRNKLAEKLIGTVMGIRSEVGKNLIAWRPGVDYRKSVSANKFLGGGVLLELSHEIDYLRWIFGEIDWVMASLSQQSKLDIDVEDTANLILGFHQDVTTRSVIGSLGMDFVRHDSVRTCTVTGETGSLRWDGNLGSVEFYDPSKNKWSHIFINENEMELSYRKELTHFIECVTKGLKPLIDGLDGFFTMKVIAAAKRSSELKIRVFTKDIAGEQVSL